MCGRYVTPKTDGLAELFGLDQVSEDLAEPTFNARPVFGEGAGRSVPIVVESVRDGERQRLLTPARWPLTPRWSKTLSTTYPTFNAVAETVTEKTTWKTSIRAHRAIFPADGYFETQGAGKSRTRFYFYPTDNGILALAGLYSWWRAEDEAPWVLTAAILTIAAPAAAATIHPRAPMALPKDLWDDWLDPEIDADRSFVDAAARLAAPQVEALRFHQVAWLDEDSSRMIEPAA